MRACLGLLLLVTLSTSAQETVTAAPKPDGEFLDLLEFIGEFEDVETVWDMAEPQPAQEAESARRSGRDARIGRGRQNGVAAEQADAGSKGSD